MSATSSFLILIPRCKQRGGFIQNNYQIEGLTPEGRTTAKLLQFNTQERIAERQRLTT